MLRARYVVSAKADFTVDHLLDNGPQALAGDPTSITLGIETFEMLYF
jgi:hypothetical protein